MSSTLRSILAGIGFLLFSLDLLEQGFAHTSKAMSTLLRTFTKTKIGAILTGSITTAVLQSSSITSLITLALVGSGVLGLTQAIGIILGANIGTTLFDGLIGYIGISGGFGIDIKAITFPLIALGGFGMMFLKKWKSIFTVIISLGVMFMSLELIKAGVSDIKTQMDLSRILGLNYGLVFLIGIGLTIAIQSSSTMTILALTFLSEGVIGFEECLALIIGAYLGTCITVVIGALGGSTIKKQVATSHVLFNVLFCAVVLILFQPIVFLLKSILLPFVYNSNVSENNNYVQVISLFHIFAKAIAVIVFYPFIDRFKSFIEKLLPHEHKNLGLRVESWNNTLSLDIKKELVQEDIKDLWKQTLLEIEEILKYPSNYHESKTIKLIESSSYLIKSVTELDGWTIEEIHNHTDMIQHMIYAMNDIANVSTSLDKLSSTESKVLQQYYQTLQSSFEEIMHGHKGYESQKSLLQTIKVADNSLIQQHTLTTEYISLISSVNHAFYQCCKNCLIAKDLM